MNDKAHAEEEPPKPSQEGSDSEIKKKSRISDLLARAIKKFEDRLDQADFKPTVGDYLKLVQLEQEVEQENLKEIKVTWIDPAVTSRSEE
jgi:hypothetical protein